MDYNYEIDLIDLMKNIIKKWRVLVVFSLVLCALLTGYTVVKTKTYHRAQNTIVVLSEDEKNPVQNIGVITRNDVVQKALESARSSTPVDKAIKNISLSRLNYSNEIVITYSTEEDDAVRVLNELTTIAVTTLNSISKYKVESRSLAVSISDDIAGPSVLKYAFLGLAGGGLLAVLCLAIKYLLENKVRDKEFVESALNYRVLAETGVEKSNYQLLRTNIEFGFRNKKVISICSFDESGKEVAEKLAESLAEINKKVLLIKSGHENDLLSNMIDKTPAEKTNNPSVISYVDQELKSNRLFSDEYKEMINNFKTFYDYVIIDTPLAMTNEAAVFCAESDGVVLVITKDFTSMSEALENKKELELIGAQVLGVVYRS